MQRKVFWAQKSFLPPPPKIKKLIISKIPQKNLNMGGGQGSGYLYGVRPVGVIRQTLLLPHVEKETSLITLHCFIM